MASSRRGSSTASSRYVVSGPYEEDHPVQNIGMGMSCAQGWATKHRAKQPELTYYVRSLVGGIAHAQITKTEDGVIHTTLVTL